MTPDIQSPNLELKLAAMKYLVSADPKAAIPVLTEALTDTHWEVRLVSLHRLGVLQATHAIPQIVACLKDPETWVRISAAEALKNLGKQGEEALKAHGKNLDLISFDIKQHIANTLW